MTNYHSRLNLTITLAISFQNLCVFNRQLNLKHSVKYQQPTLINRTNIHEHQVRPSTIYTLALASVLSRAVEKPDKILLTLSNDLTFDPRQSAPIKDM